MRSQWVVLIHSIMEGLDVKAVKLISDNILAAAKNKGDRSRLCYPSIIYCLLYSNGIPQIPGDELVVNPEPSVNQNGAISLQPVPLKRYIDDRDPNPDDYNNLRIWDFLRDIQTQWIFLSGTSQSASSSCTGSHTVNLIDGTSLVPSGMKRSGNEGKERKKERRIKRELSGGGGDHYSPPTFGGHNFHTGAPIDAPFAAMRSLSPPLRFYPRYELWVSRFHPHFSPPNLRNTWVSWVLMFCDSYGFRKAQA
ncbi:hypothetical protein PIB30_074770 [Stylosanthes scabra]|uniref:Uncharacterized protein n=1 Tax=Stylosanthes scabra TaxID=79078 RepID=A0ABU6QPV9_9FABA|nr:hypothetical protein [Stylosanthes scabra]